MDNELLNEYLGNNKKRINLSNIFTKILLSIVILLISLIYVKDSDHNLKLFKSHLFSETFNFSSFQNIYQSLKGNNKTAPVSSTLKYYNKEKYNDGYKLSVNDSLVETFISGIVVFIGNKDGFNNTVIIQGSDGYDIWYGNLSDINVSLYDYINKDTIIGSSDTLYLKVIKDGKIVDINDYLSL